MWNGNWIGEEMKWKDWGKCKRSGGAQYFFFFYFGFDIDGIDDDDDDSMQ